MFPTIIALIVGVSLGAYLFELLDGIGEFQDPHDWMVDDDEAK